MPEPAAAARTLLVVAHSKSGHVTTLVDAVVAGATRPEIAADAEVPVVVDRRSPFDVGPDDLRAADAIVVATPTNFGYMSGALKDLFDRCYREVGDDTRGTPWALVVKGDTDTTGSVSSVQRIVTGLGWRSVTDDVVVTGDVEADHLAAAEELGATLAAGLAFDLF